MLSTGVNREMNHAQTVFSKWLGGWGGTCRSITRKQVGVGGWSGGNTQGKEIPEAWAEAGARQLLNNKLECQRSGDAIKMLSTGNPSLGREGSSHPESTFCLELGCKTVGCGSQCSRRFQRASIPCQMKAPPQRKN